MPQITLSMVAAAYELSKEVRSGKIVEAQAAGSLIDNHGMSEASAYDYVRQLNLFLRGATYKRTINDQATRYFLEKISLDFAPADMAKALCALRDHIAYYEGKASKRPSLRAILAEFESRQGNYFVVAEAQFEAEVQASLNLSAKDRLKHLPKKGTKPAVKLRTIEVYARNPHVVAAALMRANGICERCEEPAPFNRKTDGSPFLEVHHKQRLAENGDDTLENAEALCPNCHRESHYGS